MKTLYQTIVLIFCLTTNTIAQTSEAAKSGYAPVNGLKIYYEIHGEGHPLVLVHGSFMTIPANYGQLIPELAKTHKVIALELQGHGRTADIDRPFSYENFADDVAGLLDYLTIEKADFIGYSLGGTITMQTAIAHPEKVGKIIFISSAFKDTGWSSDIQESIANLTVEQFEGTPIQTIYAEVAIDPGNWRDFMSKMIAFEKQPYDLGLSNIKAIPSPILIIKGDYDGVDMTHTMELFGAFGGGGTGMMEPLSPSGLAVIPSTTHITLMEKTEDLLDFIQPFLAVD
ncbi:alpha/beta fold hydrolase [Echinicola strongylocentroti]|nr:alpha/beta hydrolase [Echinicola strongylocentroti]